METVVLVQPVNHYGLVINILDRVYEERNDEAISIYQVDTSCVVASLRSQ
jgi:hypothetical protein